MKDQRQFWKDDSFNYNFNHFVQREKEKINIFFVQGNFGNKTETKN